MSKKPLVSVLTPTWNRAAYLRPLWEALNRQTFRDFEWVVANDGSADETSALVRDLARRSDFPVILIDANKHIGKPRMDNELIKQARGEFLLWNDSDDYLVPTALEALVQAWNQIPSERASEYIGITALCSDARGALQSTLPPQRTAFDTTWNELSEKLRVEGDKLFFVRSDITKKLKFIEVDYMVIESSFWYAVSDMKTRFIPEIVKIVGREAENRISFSGKMEYCRGKAHGMAVAESYPHGRRRSLRDRLWKAISYFRYCVHGDVRLPEAVKLWDGNLHAAAFAAMYPLGVAFAVKDVLQHKVRKTHLDFEQAKKDVVITTTEFSGRARVLA
jgi:glycosyltransferase involved in cell wall biosynthesis